MVNEVCLQEIVCVCFLSAMYTRVFSMFFGMLKFWYPKILACRYSGDTLVF
jgi:hypothetical protein